MATTRFTLGDAAEICLAPFIAAAERRAATRADERRREAAAATGVAWAGLGPDPASQPPAPTDILGDAAAEWTRARAYADSPRGRFLRSLAALHAEGFAAQAEAARSAFHRGLSDQATPPSIEEAACAGTALGGLDASAARTALQALHQLLTSAARWAAE